LRVCLLPKAAGKPSGERSECAISDADLDIVLRQAVQGLRQARVRYAIIGAWALSLWGKPRATADLDFLDFVNEPGLERVIRFLTESGMTIDELWQQWNPMLRGSQVRFQYRGVAVDLMCPRDLHDREIFRRRRRRRVGSEFYWVVSLEDFILQRIKLGRPRDFEDALSVVERFREKLDLNYLEHWADQLRVGAELRYIMSL